MQAQVLQARPVYFAWRNGGMRRSFILHRSGRIIELTMQLIQTCLFC